MPFVGVKCADSTVYMNLDHVFQVTVSRELDFAMVYYAAVGVNGNVTRVHGPESVAQLMSALKGSCIVNNQPPYTEADIT